MGTFIFTYNIKKYKDKSVFNSQDALEEIVEMLVYTPLMLRRQNILYTLERTFILTTNSNYDKVLHIIENYLFKESIIVNNCSEIYIHFSEIPRMDNGDLQYPYSRRNKSLQNRINKIIDKLDQKYL